MSYQTLFCRVSWILPAFIFITHLQAQTLINGSDNTVEDNSYYFESSIAEIGITTLSGASNNLTQLPALIKSK